MIIACICRASFRRSICGLLCSSWCSDGYGAMLAPLLPCNKVHRWQVASDSEPYWWTQAGICLIKIMVNCVVFTSAKFNRFYLYGQVVLLTDGMDTRPYRLSWPTSTIIFDISPDRVFKRAAEKLEGLSCLANISGLWSFYETNNRIHLNKYLLLV